MSIIDEGKVLFNKAVQYVLKEYGLLTKAIDGVWDAHTQDAYSAAAQKNGVDPVTASTQQPGKLDHLVGDLKTDVAAKLDELKGTAEKVEDAAEAIAPATVEGVEQKVEDGAKAVETAAENVVNAVEGDKTEATAATEQQQPEQGQQEQAPQQEQQQEQQQSQEQTGEQAPQEQQQSAEGDAAKQ